MQYLVIETYDNRCLTFAIDRTVTIGRSRKNEICIKDKTLSRKHLQIYFENGIYYAKDLGSRNGSFLNGISIKSPAKLTNGDKIQIGKNTIIFTSPQQGGVKESNYSVTPNVNRIKSLRGAKKFYQSRTKTILLWIFAILFFAGIAIASKIFFSNVKLF